MTDAPGAGSAGPDQPPLTIVKAGTLVDGTGAAPRRGVQIAIRNGRIVSVGLICWWWTATPPPTSAC